MFFLILFFLSNGLCFGNSKTGDEVQHRIEKFLKHLMIENQGIYTLVGIKPVTFFPLIPIIDEVEKKEIYLSQSEDFKRCIPYEKFKLNQADCRKLWNDWKKNQDQYLGKQFLILEDKKTEQGIFINIPATLFILEKWYQEFSKQAKMAFDPFEAVHFIGDQQSPFWKKIKKNHFLLGLLLGYGEQNARYFQWEREKKYEFPFRRGTSILPAHTGKPAHELTIEDLDLPGFIVYQIVDEQFEKYKIEKKRCVELYKKKDFYSFTIELLRGEGIQKEEKKLSEESKQLIKEWVNHTSKVRFFP